MSATNGFDEMNGAVSSAQTADAVLEAGLHFREEEFWAGPYWRGRVQEHTDGWLWSMLRGPNQPSLTGQAATREAAETALMTAARSVISGWAA
jgi:hypothetical protein